MRRIGILGGTFNPIHIGHLSTADVVVETLKLDHVIFVPSFLPPHKSRKNVIAALKRFAMVKLAIDGNPKFKVSDFEIKRAGKSYSIDTVGYLRTQYPKGTKFYFIIGTDVPPTLKSWKKIDELKKLVRFVAVSRKGYMKARSTVPVFYVDTNDLGVSSSDLRNRLKHKQSVRYLIPDRVLGYIKKFRLYS